MPGGVGWVRSTMIGPYPDSTATPGESHRRAAEVEIARLLWRCVDVRKLP
jgi:hypothetical protein